MSHFARFTMLALLTAFALAGTACTTYYQIEDPTTGQVYYTTDYKTKSSGAVTFTSLRTGDDVTVQNSQISKVNEQQAKYGQTPSDKQTQTKTTTSQTPAAPTKPATSDTDKTGSK